MASFEENAFTAGYNLSHPPPGEEIVITGMAGHFPDSYNAKHFGENLLNKVNLVSTDDRRWDMDHLEIPKPSGKIFGVEKFDCGFFGDHPRHSPVTDPTNRILTEEAFAAIIDAGIHPDDLKGTNTGVFLGNCYSETEQQVYYGDNLTGLHPIVGCNKSMFVNKVSYALQLNGPSFVADTACSSSVFAFDAAYRYIREGKCDAAIVCGANLCLDPYITLQFARLGVLSPDGKCKAFDNAANGYARSEAVAAIFLQKAKDAKRIYARVIHSKTNFDGFKEQGITYPSGRDQMVLLKQLYDECGYKAADVHFLEAHSTGTKVGDPEELRAIDEVYSENRKKPLLIGSVKSSIGHSEPAAAICSMVKMFYGMEIGYILPNMNFSKPREDVEGLMKGRMKVVSEKTKISEKEDGLMSLNSFGFGGANGHILFDWNNKVRRNTNVFIDDRPVLVCVNGRTEEGIIAIFDELNKNINDEFVALLHNVYKKHIPGNYYRGYYLKTSNEVYSNWKTYNEEYIPLCIFFGSNCNSLISLGENLIGCEIFKTHLEIINCIFNKMNVNMDIFEMFKKYSSEYVMDGIILTVAIQTGIVEIFKAVDCKQFKYFGELTGELAAAYSNGKLNLEQTITAAYHLGCIKKKRVSGPKEVVDLQKLYKSFLPPQKVDQLSRAVLSNFVVNGSMKQLHVLEIGYVSIKDANTKKRIKLIRDDLNNFQGFMDCIGRLYELGYDFNLAKLYPKVEWPVSRGTPMISPLLKWKHDKDWFVYIYNKSLTVVKPHRKAMINLKGAMFLKGHMIENRNLLPATMYLLLVWETFAGVYKKFIHEMSIVFEKVKFLRACTLHPDNYSELQITILKSNGYFEIVESDSVVVTGHIHSSKSDTWMTRIPLPDYCSDSDDKLDNNDFYKELRLRGYNYKDQFKAVKEISIDGSVGYVPWTGNMVTFLDNLLQLQLIIIDSRSLLVPTGIDVLYIDGREFSSKYILAPTTPLEENLAPIYVYKDLRVIRCQQIELRGMSATSVSRRKRPPPVLESYKFIPNITDLELSSSMRILIQIALENEAVTTIKVVELLEKEKTEDDELLGLLILTVISELPLVQADVHLLTKESLEIPGITVEDKSISEESNCYCIIGSNLLDRSEFLNDCQKSLKTNGGFIISREDLDFNPNDLIFDNLIIICIHTTPKEKLVLLSNKLETNRNESTCIKIKDDYKAWLEELQNEIKNENPIILYSDEQLGGILGLTNCVRRESGGKKVSCFFIQDEAPDFDLQNTFYQNQLSKNLALNVYKNGQWGTYRHVLLENKTKDCSHCNVRNTRKGDLSSLKWVENNVRLENGIHVYYCALNFKDVMLASGRIPIEVITQNRLEQDNGLGFEFAGRNGKGERVMGICEDGGLASTIYKYHSYLEVPDEWTFEEAATVPSVYLTVVYSLVMRGKIKEGSSILIHSATGGIGQAAMNVAVYYNCEIFATVGTEDKKEFLLETYPQIKAANIGCSRDTTFEQMVLKNTKGRGVDYILNSLIDEKLHCSLTCLAYGGVFLEIGKFNMFMNSEMATDLEAKGATFYSNMLDLVMQKSLSRDMAKIYKLMSSGITQKYVKPLPTNIFSIDEIEKAFRFMASGKHMGKVVIKIRDEEEEKVCPATPVTLPSIPRFSGHVSESYIIIGGLGGFGLELADWLVLRGATKLVLSSTRGIKNGYQKSRIRTWKSYGVLVHIATDDVTTKEGVTALLTEANKMGDVAAIFNLAVALKDESLENHTPETFETALGPKSVVTDLLDNLSRQLCPNLKYFVVFSSITCGRGNLNQSNYGYANSIMERICEKRKLEGYPALAVQWGAVGDVGLVANMFEGNSDVIIGGTLQQPITNCLEALDTFMGQDEPIVSSIVVAEKRDGGKGGNIVEAVMLIMGMRDLKTVSLHSTLPELGMDSMMGVEIKQTLERDYEVFLTPQDIRNLTFGRLIEISEKGKTEIEDMRLENDLKKLIKFVPSEEECRASIVDVLSLAKEGNDEKTLIIVPGVEGVARTYKDYGSKIDYNIRCCQYSIDNPPETIKEMAEMMLPDVINLVKKDGTFNLFAHSYGCVVALELSSLLEQMGYEGNLILVDGSPTMLLSLIDTQLRRDHEAEFQTGIIGLVLSHMCSIDSLIQHRIEILKCNTFDERLDLALKLIPASVKFTHEYIRKVSWAVLKRMKSVINYKASFTTIKSKVYLFRPTDFKLNLPEDYSLSELCGKQVPVQYFKGHHMSIITNPDMQNATIDIINGIYSQNEE